MSFLLRWGVGNANWYKQELSSYGIFLVTRISPNFWIPQTSLILNTKINVSLSRQLRAQGGAQPRTGHPSIARCTHTHTHTHSLSLSLSLSYWDSADMSVHLCRHAHLWDVGGNEETHPEKTHADIGRMCKLHTDGGPGQKSIFFPHQHYKKMPLNDSIIQGRAVQIL